MRGRLITIDGETHNMKEWCKLYDIDHSTVRDRMIRHGLSFEDALRMKKKFVRKPQVPNRDGIREPEKKTGYQPKNDARCRKCYYGEKDGHLYLCMFMDLNPEHRRRGCEAGPNCNEWKPRSGRITAAQRELFKLNLFGRNP